MANLAAESGIAALNFARQVTLSFLEDIPEDKLCHQAVPKTNHALWVMGHIALTDDEFLTQLGGREAKCPADWKGLFGMGSEPKPDKAAYPSPAVVRDHLGRRREELLAWCRSMDAKTLASPLPKEFQQFAPTHAAMMSSIAWHEGLHAGQMTMVRRSLGLGPKFG